MKIWIMALAAAVMPAASVLAQDNAAPPAAARSGAAILAAAMAQMQPRLDRWKQALPPATGPLQVVREERASLPEHTIFRPAQLPARPLPVIAFANGGCRNTPIEFTAFLAELASHGYMIIAAGTDDVDFALTDFQKVMPNGKPVQKVQLSVLTDAVDWAARENARPASPYFGKLDIRHLAYMGQSCGGMQALAASVDRRTTTTVVLNSAAFGPGESPKAPPGFPPSNPSQPPPISLSQLHAPVAYFIGGPTDAMYPQAEANFAQTGRLPVFNANLPVGHTGAYPAPDLRWSKAVLAWLDWRLKDDMTASKQFVGADCGLCQDSAWTVKSRNLSAR